MRKVFALARLIQTKNNVSTIACTFYSDASFSNVWSSLGVYAKGGSVQHFDGTCPALTLEEKDAFGRLWLWYVA